MLVEAPKVVCGEKPFAPCIKYLMRDNTPVLSKELIDNGQIWKLNCKLPTYNEDEDLTNEEYVKNMKDWTLYLSAYDESYIGGEDTYNELVKKRGLILIQKCTPSGYSASIGYCPKENKWYGWSHRAIYGFTIGDEVHRGDITASSGLVEDYRVQHPEEDLSLPVGYKATTLERAKRIAIAFASSVS